MGTMTARRKPPERAAVSPENKLLVSRIEAAQMLSISERGVDYLISTNRLPTRRIGGRVLIPSRIFANTCGGIIQRRSYPEFQHIRVFSGE